MPRISNWCDNHGITFVDDNDDDDDAIDTDAAAIAALVLTTLRRALKSGGVVAKSKVDSSADKTLTRTWSHDELIYSSWWRASC